MKRSRSVVGAAAAVIALAVGGCSPDEESEASTTGTAPVLSAHSQMLIEDLLTWGGSDLERAVLADRMVTDAEMQQAEDAFRACVAKAGYTAYFELMGEGYATGVSQEERDQIAARYQHDIDAGIAFEASIIHPCEAGTIETIAFIYGQLTSNPRGLTYPELLRECLGLLGLEAEAASVADEQLGGAVSGGEFGKEAELRCMTGILQDLP